MPIGGGGCWIHFFAQRRHRRRLSRKGSHGLFTWHHSRASQRLEPVEQTSASPWPAAQGATFYGVRRTWCVISRWRILAPQRRVVARGAGRRRSSCSESRSCFAGTQSILPLPAGLACWLEYDCLRATLHGGGARWYLPCGTCRGSVRGFGMRAHPRFGSACKSQAAPPGWSGSLRRGAGFDAVTLLCRTRCGRKGSQSGGTGDRAGYGCGAASECVGPRGSQAQGGRPRGPGIVHKRRPRSSPERDDARVRCDGIRSTQRTGFDLQQRTSKGAGGYHEVREACWPARGRLMASSSRRHLQDAAFPLRCSARCFRESCSPTFPERAGGRTSSH